MALSGWFDPLKGALGLLCALCLCGCSGFWSRDNPADPFRCDPACSGGQVCRDGACVWPFDGGIPEAGFAEGGPFPGDASPPLTDLGACVTPQAKASCAGGWCAVAYGCFYMGAAPNETCAQPATETFHRVEISRPFEMQQREVTQAEFNKQMGYYPGNVQSCGDCPVTQVTWHEAAAYCNSLSVGQRCYVKLASSTTCTKTSDCTSPDICMQDGPIKRCLHYEVAPTYQGSDIKRCPGARLPTEAEWEYAYRAGTTTAYHSGKNADPKLCEDCNAPPDPAVADIGWFCNNSGRKIQAVKGKKPNAWGLYDMAGNAWEWCHDWWSVDLGRQPVTDPAGPPSGAGKVIRGGAAGHFSANLRAAYRTKRSPNEHAVDQGFRCVKTVFP